MSKSPLGRHYPSPWGEGKGEGDRDVRKPKPFDENRTQLNRSGLGRGRTLDLVFSHSPFGTALDAPLIWSPLLEERARVRGTAILDNLEAHPKRPAALHSPALNLSESGAPNVTTRQQI